jgi:hypothetical protein
MGVFDRRRQLHAAPRIAAVVSERLFEVGHGGSFPLRNRARGVAKPGR